MTTDPTMMPPTITNRAIAAAAAEFRRLALEASEAREAAAALEAARPEIEATDRRSLGRALAEGQPDPGSTALAQHDADTAAAHRRHEALDAATTEAAAVFNVTMARHRTGWLEAVEVDATKARARYATAVAALVTARAQVDELEATARWASRWPAAKPWTGPVAAPVRGLLARSGDPFGWAEVAAALEADAAPPAPIRPASAA